MDKVIAYCGLVCTDCPAYIATQAGDRAGLERVAAQWREEFNAPNISAESVLCDGCLTDLGHKFGHCHQCEIRACGMERALLNCAYCEDYACGTLQEFFGLVPEAQVLLAGIRAHLAA
jgi:hypothetical protein